MGERKGQSCVINQPLAPPLKLGATKMHRSPSCGQQGELARGPESKIPALSLMQTSSREQGHWFLTTSPRRSDRRRSTVDGMQ